MRYCSIHRAGPVPSGGTGWHTAAVTTASSSSRITAAELPALRRRTSAVLIGSQILGGLGVAVGIALAPVLAAEVSGSEALSGLAPTASVTGTALLSLPLAALMTSRGRRPGLVLAYLTGALGALLVVTASVVGSFPLLLLGMAGFGAGSSANLQARFAAADLAEPERRGRAISHVIWATTIGSVLGPNIAAPASAVFRGTVVPETAGPFAWAFVIFLLTGSLVAVLLRPDPLLTARAFAPEGTETAANRSLRAGIAAVRAAPMARLALVTVAVSHTAMVSVMVMTPVHLGHHGADIQLIGLVISGHIAGMYAFSPSWAGSPTGPDGSPSSVWPPDCCASPPCWPARRGAGTPGRPPGCSSWDSAGRRGWSPDRPSSPTPCRRRRGPPHRACPTSR